LVSLYSMRMDVLTSETCWALNKVIIKQVASSWSLFTHQPSSVFPLIPTNRFPDALTPMSKGKVLRLLNATPCRLRANNCRLRLNCHLFAGTLWEWKFALNIYVRHFAICRKTPSCILTIPHKVIILWFYLCAAHSALYLITHTRKCVYIYIYIYIYIYVYVVPHFSNSTPNTVTPMWHYVVVRHESPTL